MAQNKTLWVKVESIAGGRTEKSVREVSVRTTAQVQAVRPARNQAEGVSRFELLARPDKNSRRSAYCVEVWTEDGKTLLERWSKA